MKKLIAIIVILLTNIVIFSACAGNHNSHAYTWVRTQDGHYREYNCDCPTSEPLEAHYDNNGDSLCDVCNLQLPKDLTSGTPDSSPDNSSTDSSVDSSTPDSSPDDSSTDSSVDSSIPDSSTDNSSTDSSVDSSIPDSSPDDSSTDSSGSYNPDDSSTEDSNPDQPSDNPPITGHEHSYTTKVTAPTCEAEGYTTYTCGCGDSYTADKISAKGHTETTVAGKDATCTSSGLTVGSKCSVCGEILTAQTVIPAKGHTETIIVGTAATCTANGLTNGAKCTVCGEITVTQTEISATGHSWTPATTSAPKTCTVCSATEGEKLPSSGSGSSSTTTYPTLTVNYINVGQGDSIFIKVEDCDILIDAGKSGQGSTVVNYLKSQGVDDIELMINSHPDDDHYGGLPTVMSNYVIEKAWISPFSKTTSTYTSFKEALSKECSYSTPSVGTVYSYQQLTLTVIYNGSGASNSNDSSLVLMLEYGNFRFLFTGDISSTIESKIVNKDISCDVLKVPHHGSAGSSSSAFLNATGASYGVICVGSNSYGHPTSTALNNLSSAGISVYRTDQDGNVVFSTNGATLTTPSGNSVNGGSDSGSSSGGSSSGSTTTSSYVGNSSSKVFHYASCGSAPTTNAVNLSSYTYSQIISLGYRPCSNCIGSGSSSSYTYVLNTSSKKIHELTCSYVPTTNAEYVNGTLSYYVNTLGYDPCARCIGSSSSTTTYILNTSSGVFHLSSCGHKPTTNAKAVTYSYDTMISNGYNPCSYCLG